MKKKVLPTLVTLVVALVLSLFTVACGGNHITFKVTAEYDAARGSVTVSDADGKAATTFKAGDRVVVTVTPDEGYIVDEFKVNGVDEELNNGVYTCFASSNILVKVTFKADDQGGVDPPKPVDPVTEEDFAAAYDSVKTTFIADGQYTYKVEGGDVTVNPVTTIFGTNAVNIIEIDADTGDVLYDDVYVDVDGNLAMPVHTLNNTIEYIYPTPMVEYSEYGNPFKLLTPSDFASTEQNGVFELTAADKKNAAATAITGYTETIVDFSVTVSGGKIAKVNIVTDRIERTSSADGSKYYYTATYAYTLSDWNEADVDSDKTAPYATESHHTALEDALAAMMLAKNYTVAVHEEEVFYEGLPGDGYGDLDYDVYVTETAIYYDCEGWEEGYVEMTGGGDKIVCPFDYDPETETGKLYDAVKGFSTVASMSASFNGFAPEIFELAEDGAYVLRDACYTLDNVHNILINFGDGLDQIRLYMSYTLDVKFRLNDDGGLQVELYYYVGDAYVLRVLTYCNVNETELPITVSDSNFEKVSALDDYVGTYTDGTHTAVIDKTSITIDGSPYEVTDYSIQYDMFTGNYNGGVWYVTKLNKKQLAVYFLGETEADDISYVLTSTELDAVEIPEAYNGVWTKDGTVAAIAYNKIEYSGKMLTVLSDEGENGLYATDGKYTYRFWGATIKDDDDNEVECLVSALYSDGIYVSGLVLYKDDTVTIIPEALIGTFEKFDSYYNKNYKAVVRLTTVALELGGDKPAVTVTKVTNDGYAEITLDVNGVEYFIQEYYTSDQVVLGSVEISPNFNVTLNRVEEVETPPTTVEVPESFYGEYEGEKDGISYAIGISADGITVKIGDGEAKTATVTAYDDHWNALTLDIDGEEYGIACEDETSISFSNSDFSIYVTLNRKGGDSIVIPEKYYGSYSATKDGTSYYIDISEDGIYVTMGDSEIKAVIVVYDETDGYITVTLDGTTYDITDMSYDEPISKIMLATSDYSTYVTLNRLA